jgi:hypothetical protein
MIGRTTEMTHRQELNAWRCPFVCALFILLISNGLHCLSVFHLTFRKKHVNINVFKQSLIWWWVAIVRGQLWAEFLVTNRESWGIQESEAILTYCESGSCSKGEWGNKHSFLIFEGISSLRFLMSLNKASRMYHRFLRRLSHSIDSTDSLARSIVWEVWQRDSQSEIQPIGRSGLPMTNSRPGPSSGSQTDKPPRRQTNLHR